MSDDLKTQRKEEGLLPLQLHPPGRETKRGKDDIAERDPQLTAFPRFLTSITMFERFTDRARKVMAISNQIAQAHHQDFILPEHILLALLREGGGTVRPVLERQNVDLGQLERDAAAALEHSVSNSPPGKLPLKPLAKTVIEQAIHEARALNHNFVGTEHLILGLLHLTDPPLPSLFARYGITLDPTRDIVRQITHSVGSHPSPSGSHEIGPILHLARHFAENYHSPELMPGHLLLALLAEHDIPGTALCAEVLIEWLHRMRAANPLPGPNVCLDDLRLHLAKKLREQPPTPDTD